jgi:hypothetical protein
MILKRDSMHTTLRRTILTTIILLALCGIASADLNVWSSTGPLAPVTGQRAVHALAISPDGSTIYSGLNSGTVFSLTFGPVPAVLSVSPATGPVAGGTVVTITGTGFTGATAVKFDTADATSYTVNSATQITATAPAGSAGTIDVRVTTPGGTSPATSADVYTYTGPATHFAVTATSPQTVGTMFTFTVTALDAWDNTATDYPGTVHFTSSDLAATIPPDSVPRIPDHYRNRYRDRYNHRDIGSHHRQPGPGNPFQRHGTVNCYCRHIVQHHGDCV